MSVKKGEQICRLCLKVANNKFEKVDGFVKQIFDALFLKLDLDISKDPIICQACLVVAKTCLVFKSNCIGVEKTILSFTTVMEGGKVSIKVILKEIPFAEEDLDICRFCLTRLERKNFVPLDTLMNQAVFEMLPEYMPEMDFNIIENPIICTTCKKQLEDYLKFVLNSLDIQRKIKSYYKEGTDRMRQVKLSSIVQYSFKDIVEYPTKCPQICVIKEELNTFEHTESVCPEACGVLIKQEELVIKEEELNLDQKSHKNLPEVHKAKNRVDGNKMYKCSSCDYESKRKCYINTHMVVHKDISDIKMYKCSLCAFETKRKRNLNTHILVHKNISKIKTYRCSMCTYDGKRKGDLNKHMLIHKDISDIKMYKCSLCAFDTRRKSCLREHVLVHKNLSEIKTHKCPLCSYEFKRKGDLNKHMLLIHKDISKIKMYKCSLCAFETKRKKGLKPHMLVHKNISEIKMQRCSLCTFETKWKSSVRKHMLIHKQNNK